jgi:hypothetical protein
MANFKISDLTDLPSPATTAVLEVEDSAATPASRKLTLASLKTHLNGGYDVPSVIYRSGTPVAISNTNAETTLFAQNIPAGILGTNRRAVLAILGDMLNSSGATQTFTVRVYLGGVKVIDDITPAINSAGSRRVTRMEIAVSNLESATSQLITLSGNALGGSMTTGVGDIGASSQNWTPLAEGTAAANTALATELKITIQPTNALSTIDWRMKHCTLVVL